jgi:hypothetical protein
MDVFLTSLRKIPKSMQIKFNAPKKLQNSTHVKRAITARLELENKISPD